ncbi:MAG: hypothetical protein FJX76_04835 [Armatimonadetes bacterium]|nr:hypothetical protein [Armatimonadota bacterium]
MSESSTSSSGHESGRGLVGPVAFGLGLVSGALLAASSESLQKNAGPALTSVLKRGIRLARAARGAAERVAGTIMDAFAKAQSELEKDEAAHGQ